MKFNHINIWTEKLTETVAFYGTLFGAVKGKRPAFTFPGVWLYVDDKPVIHIIEVATSPKESGVTDYFSEKNEKSEQKSTNLHHIAFEEEDLEQFIKKIEEQKIEYSKAVIPESEEVQLFINDPNNIKIEIIFFNQKRNV